MTDPNPYQAPESGMDQQGIEPMGNPLVLPAIILILLASLSLVFTVLAMVPMSYELVSQELRTNNPPAGKAGYVTSSVAFPVCVLIGTLIVLRGAIHMVGLKKFGAAKSGAIFACIPLCAPCILLGIPFGIWALVCLNRPGVKAMFAKQ